MYHSITLSPVDKPNVSYDVRTEWQLLPTSRLVFAPPQMKTNFVDMPGAHGSIDMSTVLTGYPTYQNREGSFEFVIADYGTKECHEVYSDIMTKIHGQTMRAVLEDDPGYYYKGLFTVNGWKSNNGSMPNITIDYNVSPFKYETTAPTQLFDIESSSTVETLNVGMMPPTDISVFSARGGSIFVIDADGISEKEIVLSSTSAWTALNDGAFVPYPGTTTCNFRYSGESSYIAIYLKRAVL